jgi:hypothetical protein
VILLHIFVVLKVWDMSQVTKGTAVQAQISALQARCAQLEANNSTLGNQLHVTQQHFWVQNEQNAWLFSRLVGRITELERQMALSVANQPLGNPLPYPQNQ